MNYYRWLLTDRHLQDLNPLVAGTEECKPGKSFGPAVRSYTLIHYVRAGKGTFYINGMEYPVIAGQAFLIPPGEVTTYKADEKEPWHYSWVGFNGNLSHRFKSLPPVFDLDEDSFLRIFPCEKTVSPELYIAAGLLMLYGTLFPEKEQVCNHVDKVRNLIHTDYMHPLRVEDIAREINLDRRYLTRIFKEQTGFSVQQYLIKVRLEAADSCLSRGATVQECAKLCGYEDYSLFSRLYKKHRGCSPAFRKDRQA